ncbi:hypothetical protein K458DRAFT_393869 [Lentithecium fluviatile CBS 122367]|uniref:Uncharacterized protein n=1 Tax=Lentithecium fluviatile CBS 122367 TaxID=1168545 RepID=A0A6G1INK6_9PLEO|nr:hypothetical protein K458DRAFT_393869 [Lentithecium fluviatile CBS 122367]
MPLVIGVTHSTDNDNGEVATNGGGGETSRRGLIPVLPRQPFPVRLEAPKPAKPDAPSNSGDGPPPPARPAPGGPSTPNSPDTDTPGLRPQDPESPPPNTQNPEPVVQPIEPVTPPPDTQNPDSPVVQPSEPKTPPSNAPEDPNAPGTRPSDPEDPPPNTPEDTDGPNFRDDGSDSLPPGSACGVPGLRARAPTPCVKPPTKLEVGPDSIWAKNGVEDARQKGHQAINELDIVIKEGRQDIEFKGKDGTPLSENKGHVYTEQNMYKVDTDNDPLMGDDSWQNEALFKTWSDGEKANLISAGYNKREVETHWGNQDLTGTGSILSTQQNPLQGSKIVQLSDSKNDLYEPHKYEAFKG